MHILIDKSVNAIENNESLKETVVHKHDNIRKKNYWL